MNIIKILGGLGNQMFQYAYAKALMHNETEVKIDTTAFDTYKLHGGYQLNKYNISLNSSSKDENNLYYKSNTLTKLLKKLGIRHPTVIKEKTLLFDRSFLEIEDDKYIDGYFQNENYFKNIREVLLNEFTIKKKLSKYTLTIKEKISESNSCSIHVRRGDYLNNKNILIHGVCNIDYYKKALAMVKLKNKNINYFIFSDDIEWVKENLKIENAIYIKSEETRIPHEDIYLMSLCNYNIIANSSFSWWGAWLNQYKNKVVIAPKNWFIDEKLNDNQDIVCAGWIKI